MVASFFGKNASFSGREYIWREAIKSTLSCIVTGNGVEDSATTFLKIGQTHVHSFLLENLYRGGIIAIILILFFIWSCRPSVGKSQKFPVPFVTPAIAVFLLAGGIDWLYYNPLPMALFYYEHYLKGLKIDNSLSISSWL